MRRPEFLDDGKRAVGAPSSREQHGAALVAWSVAATQRTNEIPITQRSTERR